ncbi:MAG: type IV secretory system conjugative DNA transfer family protein, partial [Acidimicrobiales bacterium]
ALVVLAAFVRVVARLRAPAAGQLVEVAVRPAVEAKAGLGFWRNLHTVLSGTGWSLGRPGHVAFEIESSAHGLGLRFWVSFGVSAHAVARAVSSAWPGAQCQVRDAEVWGLLSPVASVGELRLGAPPWLPLGTDHPVDPLRTILGALPTWDDTQRAIIQILVRPAAGRSCRMLHRSARSLETGRPMALLPRLLAAWRTTPARPVPHDPMRSADVRHAVAKASDLPAFEVAVRLGLSTSERGRRTRRQLRAGARELSAAFGVYAGRNHFVVRHRSRCRRRVERRVLGRGQVLGLSEVAALAHLPVDLPVPGLHQASATAVAPPMGVLGAIREDVKRAGRTTTMRRCDGSSPLSGVRVIGDSEAGPRRAVALSVESGRYHNHVVGATGSGKSTLLANLALADMAAGRGVVVIDPKGDLVEDLLARLPERALGRLVLIDPKETEAPPALNVLDGEPREVAVDHVVSVFARIFAAWRGPRTDDVLRSACATLRRLPGATLADIPVLLTDRRFRAPLVAALSERSGLKGFWDGYDALSPAGQAQVIGPIMNKLRAVLARRFARDLFGSARSSFDMKEVLSGGALLARLPKGILGEDTARLVGALLVASVWQAATGRADDPVRPDATVYIDECQNFLALPTAVDDVLAEARGYHLAVVLAHQHLDSCRRTCSRRPRRTPATRSTSRSPPRTHGCSPGTPSRT